VSEHIKFISISATREYENTGVGVSRARQHFYLPCINFSWTMLGSG